MERGGPYAGVTSGGDAVSRLHNAPNAAGSREPAAFHPPGSRGKGVRYGRALLERIALRFVHLAANQVLQRTGIVVELRHKSGYLRR